MQSNHEAPKIEAREHSVVSAAQLLLATVVSWINCGSGPVEVRRSGNSNGHMTHYVRISIVHELALLVEQLDALGR